MAPKKRCPRRRAGTCGAQVWELAYSNRFTIGFAVVRAVAAELGITRDSVAVTNDRDAGRGARAVTDFVPGSRVIAGGDPLDGGPLLSATLVEDAAAVV